jgi:phage gp16-like protein
VTAALVKKIHIAKSQLALADETYRDILRRVTGQTSSKACSERQLEAVLVEFKRLGWAPKSRNAYSDRPYVRKVYALWKEAAQVGAVADGGKVALRSFVERQTRPEPGTTGKEAPEFLTPAEANRVTEALKAMIARAPG